MRIAICEDEEFIQNSIEKNVEKCLEITGMAGKCECFVSAEEAFDVQAFQYLVKPIDSDTAHNVIMRALRIIREKRNYIRFTNKLKDMIFYYDEVECIESRRRKIIVHTEKRDYEFYGSLSQIEEDIKGSMFVRVHNSYLVNLEKLREVERESVTLRSGLKVPITRTYKQEFNKAYQKFILMSKGGRE